MVKIFNKNTGELVYNDCGFLGELSNKRQITTQWIDPSNSIKINNDGFEVKGKFNYVPSNKYFNTIKFIIFRIILLLIGWKPSWAHWFKGLIRKILMLGVRPVNLNFKLNLKIKDNKILIEKKLEKFDKKLRIIRMISGGEFFVRYVPQSRFFQSQELDIQEFILTNEDLKIINKGESLIKKIEI